MTTTHNYNLSKLFEPVHLKPVVIPISGYTDNQIEYHNVQIPRHPVPKKHTSIDEYKQEQIATTEFIQYPQKHIHLEIDAPKFILTQIIQ